jgi:hypothetical protein
MTCPCNHAQQVWKGSLWGKPVAVKVLPLADIEERQLECLRREVAVLLHTTGECKQVRARHRGPAGIRAAAHVATAASAAAAAQVRPQAQPAATRSVPRIRVPPVPARTHAGVHLQGLLREGRQLCDHHEALQLQPGHTRGARTRWGVCTAVVRLCLACSPEQVAGDHAIGSCTRKPPDDTTTCWRP